MAFYYYSRRSFSIIHGGQISLWGLEKFPWPKDESGIKELSKHELSMLLDGIDFFHAHKILQFKSVG
jgi:hypothetical protein